MADDTTTGDQPAPARTFTQDQLDAAIAERLKRERAKYSDYDDLKAKAGRLDEIEEREKSEVERLTQQLAEERKAREAETAKALRAEVAADRGVPMALLSGGTREEIEQQADALLAFKGDKPASDTDDADADAEAGDGGETTGGQQPAASNGDRPPRRPTERLQPGAAPTTDPTASAAEIAKRVVQRRSGVL